jgi:hypothetical protein
MEQSSTNEDVISGNNETIEICMNVVLEEGSKENPSIQTKTNRNSKNGTKKIMKANLKNCMLKGKYGNQMAKFLYVGIFIV